MKDVKRMWTSWECYAGTYFLNNRLWLSILCILLHDSVKPSGLKLERRPATPPPVFPCLLSCYSPESRARPDVSLMCSKSQDTDPSAL